MALLFCDSFNHYLDADLLKKWDYASSESDLVVSTAYGLAPYAQGCHFNGTDRELGKIIANTVTFIAGGWVRLSSFAGSRNLMRFVDTATEHVSLRNDTSGRLTFTRNGTVLATSTNMLSLNTWYHIEVKCTIGDAADTPSGRYEVRVNGSSVGWIPDSGTGQDTRNGANQYINRWELKGGNANGNDWTEVYILDTSGSVATDFLGPVRIAVMRPDGAGTNAEWSGNYAANHLNVGEQYTDGDVTFNQSDTNGEVDTFLFGRVPAGTIHAIQHCIMARQDAGTGRTIRPIDLIGGTEYGGTTCVLGATHVMFTRPESVSPATSAQWTDSEINGAEFGYERVS